MEIKTVDLETKLNKFATQDAHVYKIYILRNLGIYINIHIDR